MAYSTITDTELQPGKPGSSSLFFRLRDNAIAMITGLAGAPKILDAAFNLNSINANKLINNSVGAAQIAASAIGSSELASNSVQFSSDVIASASNSAITVTTSYQTFTFKGVYTFGRIAGNGSSLNQLLFEVWNGAAWFQYSFNAQLQTDFHLTLVSDGTNIRFRQTGGANQNLTYRNNFI